MGGGLSAYATSAGRGCASRAVRLNRRWSAGAGERRCVCRRGRGWDDAAAAGVAGGRPLAVRARRLRRGPQEEARGRECSGGAARPARARGWKSRGSCVAVLETKAHTLKAVAPLPLSTDSYGSLWSLPFGPL